MLRNIHLCIGVEKFVCVSVCVSGEMYIYKYVMCVCGEPLDMVGYSEIYM